MRINILKNQKTETAIFKEFKIYKFKQNDTIFQIGDIVEKYCLISKGQVGYISQQGAILHIYKTGTIINYTEASLQVPCMKSVKALSQVQIQIKTVFKPINMSFSIIKQEQANCTIAYLRSLTVQQFSQITQYLELRKHQKLAFLDCKQQNIYFVKSGKVVILNETKNKFRKMGLILLATGSIINKIDGIMYRVQQKSEVYTIKIQLIKDILKNDFDALLKILKVKESLLDNKLKVNELIHQRQLQQQKSVYLRRDLLKNKEKRSILSKYESLKQSPQFRQKLKSCFIEKKHYLQIKNHYHNQLCNLNKHIYGQAYIFNKRLQINNHINNHDFSSQNMGVFTLYEPSTVHQNFSHIKNFSRLKKKNYKYYKSQTPLINIKKFQISLEKNNKQIFQKLKKKHILSNLR